jgi:hypothetical protein
MLSIDTGTPSETTSFFVGRDRLLRAVGPGGFRADVDDVGTLGDHAPRLRQRALRGDKLSAVGK